MGIFLVDGGDGEGGEDEGWGGRRNKEDRRTLKLKTQNLTPKTYASRDC
jgi:hypothetical protein